MDVQKVLRYLNAPPQHKIYSHQSSSVGGFSSLWVALAQVVVLQLHILRLPGSIPATHTNVGTGGTVL